MKQAIWQIYLPARKNIPRPTFDVQSPNAIHQADLLFIPHDIHTYIHTYIDTLLRLPSTGLFSHNVTYYIVLVIKKRKENLFTVVQLNSKYIQNYSKYIQNYFV